MNHVYWVIPGLLAGRCGPDKIPWDPAQLHAAGLRVVVTAASEVPVADLASFELRHRRVRMAPLPWLWRRGQRRLVKQARAILPYIHQQLEDGRPTLVHCHDGDDRTGVVLSGYLVTYRGVTPEQAVAEVRRANPRAMKMPGYAQAVRWFADGAVSDRSSPFYPVNPVNPVKRLTTDRANGRCKQRRAMTKKIEITAGDVTVTGELNDSSTAEKVWNALPIEASASTWGDEIYFGIPVNAQQAPDARAEVEVGTLAYWPVGSAFCIFFGPTPASRADEPRAYSPVNIIGRVVDDATQFRSVANGAPVRIEAAE